MDKMVCKICGTEHTACNTSAGHFWVADVGFGVGDKVVFTTDPLRYGVLTVRKFSDTRKSFAASSPDDFNYTSSMFRKATADEISAAHKPRSFAVGDWVTGTEEARTSSGWWPSQIQRITEVFPSTHRVATTAIDLASMHWFRHATPDEIKTVTHFAPKMGMILRYKNNYEHTVMRVYQVEEHCAWAYMLDRAEMKAIPLECSHEDFEILDSYEVLGRR